MIVIRDDQMDNLIGLFHQIMALCHLLLREELKKHHLTFSHALVLHFLNVKGASPLVEISKHLDIPLSSLSGMIGRLEEMGMVLRKRDQKDRRIVQIRLTDKSREMIDELSDSQRNKIYAHVKRLNLSSEEMERFIENMQRFIEGVHENRLEKGGTKH